MCVKKGQRWDTAWLQLDREDCRFLAHNVFWNHLTMGILSTDYRYGSWTGLLSCFASTNSWFVTRNHHK
jgi:hypothetical protein